MQVMEIIAPRGSMRLEDFPTFEEFSPPDFLYNVYSYRIPSSLPDKWRKMTEAEKLDCYFKQRKRSLGQQCQGIKAFMRQHKRRNGHKREPVS